MDMEPNHHGYPESEDWIRGMSPGYKTHKYGAGYVTENDLIQGRRVFDPAWEMGEGAQLYYDNPSSKGEPDYYSYDVFDRYRMPHSPEVDPYDSSHWSAFEPSAYDQMQDDILKYQSMNELYARENVRTPGDRSTVGPKYNFWQYGRAALGLLGDYRSAYEPYPAPEYDPLGLQDSEFVSNLIFGSFTAMVVLAWYTVPSDHDLGVMTSRLFEWKRLSDRDKLLKKQKESKKKQQRGEAKQNFMVKNDEFLNKEEKEMYEDHSLINLMMSNADYFIKKSYVLDLALLKVATFQNYNKDRFYFVGIFNHWLPLPTLGMIGFASQMLTNSVSKVFSSSNKQLLN